MQSPPCRIDVLLCVWRFAALPCSIPFVLARLRGVNPRVDRMMHSVANFMGADPPSMSGKVAKQPAPKDFLSKLKVTKYVQPQDLEAGSAEGGLLCLLTLSTMQA